MKFAAALFLLLGLMLVLSSDVCFAQETFRIKNSSPAYELNVTIDKCDEEAKRLVPTTCSGPGKIRIYRKGSTSPFQVLELKNIEVYADSTAYNPSINKNVRKLYEEEYSFVFDDFNFDGMEDLAVCNGREGGYGGPSYNIYLYDLKSKQFVENVKLSQLTEGAYLGLFFVDKKRKQLTAYSKSGCCYHETDIFKLINNKPVLLEKTIEEAEGTDDRGYVVTITTKRLVNGRWVKRVRKEKRAPESP